MAVVVADGVPVATVGAVIRRRGGSLLRGVRLFDVYRGAPLGADEKSLAFRLVLQSADRTLTDEEVETVMADVRAGFEAELGAHVRA